MPISVNPAVAGIPYGDRKRIMELCKGREDLVDLMSGNPYQQMPKWIRRRAAELFDCGPMRYTHYWGMPELRQRLAEKLQAECGISAGSRPGDPGYQRDAGGPVRGDAHPAAAGGWSVCCVSIR